MMSVIYWKSKIKIKGFNVPRIYTEKSIPSFLFFLFECSEKQEKNTALLKNAEISQSEERLKQELRNESHELSEVNEQLEKVQTTLQSKTTEIIGLNNQISQLNETIQKQTEQIHAIEEMRIEIIDKNKVS